MLQAPSHLQVAEDCHAMEKKGEYRTVQEKNLFAMMAQLVNQLEVVLHTLVKNNRQIFSKPAFSGSHSISFINKRNAASTQREYF